MVTSKKRENPTEWSEVSPRGDLKDLLGWDSKCVINMRQLITANRHLWNAFGSPGSSGVE